MSQENVEIVRRGFEGFLATGEPVWELTHEHVVVADHDLMDAGEYRGHAGFTRWLADWASAWSEFTSEPAEEILDAGDDVVIVYRLKATGRASGVTVERQDAMVCRVQDGKIVRLDYYNDRSQALKSVGLEE
jgi:ketosteroid isomerase-like protein